MSLKAPLVIWAAAAAVAYGILTLPLDSNGHVRAPEAPGLAELPALIAVPLGLMLGAMGSKDTKTERKTVTGPGKGHATLNGTATVIDGDTLDVQGTRIRLYGVDAPETRQTCRKGRREWDCGQAATTALRDKLGRRQVRCEQTGSDRYGRVVARCSLGGQDIGSWLVRNGWAAAYVQYGGRIYSADQEAARSAGKGIWAGEFTMPWDWRKEKRS